MRPGLISPRSARKMTARRKRRGGYNYGGTSADGQSLYADEGHDRGGGAMPPDYELDSREYQAGGRVSRGGGAGPEQNPIPHNAINHARNRKVWPKGAQISSSNPKTGNSRMLGGLAGSNGNPGGWYSGGNGRSRG